MGAATYASLPPTSPLEPALGQYDAEDVADACSWLLGDELGPAQASELDDIARMQRRRTESGLASQQGSPPLPRASVDLAPTFVGTPPYSRASPDMGYRYRASYDVPRPLRASLDCQWDARGASLDVPRPAQAAEGQASGVMGWLAAWGKLAKEQGCEASPAPPARQAASPPLPPHASPRPSLSGRACLAAASSFYSSGLPPRQPHDAPALQPTCLEPAAALPQQHQAWPSEPSSSNNSDGHSPQSSAQRRLSFDEPGHSSSRQRSSFSLPPVVALPEGLPSAYTPFGPSGPAPTHLAARASMDGWADSGCSAAAEAQKLKRKREAAAALAAAQAAAMQLSLFASGAPARTDSLSFGYQLPTEQHQQRHQQAHRRVAHYTLRGSLDGGHRRHSSLDVPLPAPLPARGSASLDLPRPPPPGALPGPPLATAGTFAAAAKPPAPASTPPAEDPGVFSMAAWDAALPLDLLTAGVSTGDGDLAAALASPRLPLACGDDPLADLLAPF